MATNVTPEKDSLAALTAEFGRRGGKARLTTMCAEERSRIARLAAQARWAKKTTAPDPSDPKGPKRDQPGERSGIMSTRKPRRQTGVALTQPTLFEIPEAA
jgi:hypothetical protein